MSARELDRLPRDAARDPCQVARRDLVGFARPDAERRAVVHADVEPAGDGVADVAMLARFRARDRSNVGGPIPSRLEDEAADGDLVEVDDLDDAIREPPDLVGAAESFALKAGHGHDVS